MFIIPKNRCNFEWYTYVVCITWCEWVKADKMLTSLLDQNNVMRSVHMCGVWCVCIQLISWKCIAIFLFLRNLWPTSENNSPLSLALVCSVWKRAFFPPATWISFYAISKNDKIFLQAQATQWMTKPWESFPVLYTEESEHERVSVCVRLCLTQYNREKKISRKILFREIWCRNAARLCNLLSCLTGNESHLAILWNKKGSDEICIFHAQFLMKFKRIGKSIGIMKSPQIVKPIKIQLFSFGSNWFSFILIIWDCDCCYE